MAGYFQTWPIHMAIPCYPGPCTAPFSLAISNVNMMISSDKPPNLGVFCGKLLLRHPGHPFFSSFFPSKRLAGVQFWTRWTICWAIWLKSNSLESVKSAVIWGRVTIFGPSFQWRYGEVIIIQPDSKLWIVLLRMNQGNIYEGHVNSHNLWCLSAAHLLTLSQRCNRYQKTPSIHEFKQRSIDHSVPCIAVKDFSCRQQGS